MVFGCKGHSLLVVFGCQGNCLLLVFGVLVDLGHCLLVVVVVVFLLLVLVRLVVVRHWRSRWHLLLSVRVCCVVLRLVLVLRSFLDPRL